MVMCRNIILQGRKIVPIILIEFVAFFGQPEAPCIFFKRLKLLRITGFVVLKVSCKVIL